MFIRLFKVAPGALACALSLSLAAAPSFAQFVVADGHAAKAGNSVEDRQLTPTLAPDVNVATAQDANSSARTKKHENAFLRALAAPFRALARLFGGGKKSTQAKNTKSTPAPQRTQQATNTTPTPVTETQSASNSQTPTKLAPQAQAEGAARSTAKASRHDASAPAARRSNVAKANATPAPPPSLADAPASAATPAQPEKFMPVPEGVPLDPLSQGRALLERGDAHAALAPLSIAAVTGPDLLAANNLLGLAYDHLGQHKLAVECYTRALIAAPNDPATLNNLGHSLYLADRYVEALARLQQAARLLPNDPQVANNLALVYGRLHKYGDAYKQFARAGGEFYARMQTGALLEAAGRDRDAIKHFEAARRLDPTNSEALRHLINLYVRTGQPGKAEDARRQLNNKPENKHAASSSSTSSV